MTTTVKTNKKPGQPPPEVLRGIKEILEDYASNPDEQSSESCAVEILTLVLQNGRWCSYRPGIFCYHIKCCGCPVWAKESGYLAYCLNQS